MAGEEEILFNVNGNVGSAVSALNEWVSAIQNVQKAFGELSSSISDLSKTFDGLTQSIDEVVGALDAVMQSGAADTLATLVEASDALDQTGTALTQTLNEETAALTELSDNASTASDALASLTPSAEDLDTVLTSLTDGIGTVATELSTMGPDADDAMQAMIDLAQAVGDAEQFVSVFAGDADALDVALTTVTPALVTAQKALMDLGDAGAPALAAFAGMTSAVDQSNPALAQISAMLQQAASNATDTASQIEAASQVVASSSANYDATSASIAGLGGEIDAVTQTFFALAGSANQVQPALVQVQTQVQQVGQGFQQAAQGTMSFEDALTAIIEKIDAVAAALDGLTASELTNKDAEDADKDGANADGMMLMMLIPMITSVAGGFLQMGMAAEDSIAKITGLADQSLQGASGMARLDSTISQLDQDTLKYGGTLKDTADGMYFIISEGFQGAGALKVLDSAMEASSATGTKFQTVATALTSVMNAYGLTADQARQTQDQLTAAVVSGAQTYDTFANAIGKTAAQGKAAGFSLREVLAAESAMTRVNPSVRQDTANLGNLMNVLHNNMDKTANSAKGLSLKFNEQQYAGMDLVEKLKYLQSATHNNWTEMRALLGNATATNAAFYILANGGKNVSETLDAQSQSAGALDKAFQSTSQTISFALGRITGALSVMAYTVVAAIGPSVSAIFQKFADVLSSVASNANILVPIVSGLGAILGVILIAAIGAVTSMFWGMLVPFGAIAIAIGIVVAAIAALIPRLQAMAQGAGPIGTMLRDMVATVKSTAMTLRDALGGALAALHPMLQGFGTILHTVVMPALASLAGGVGYSVAQIINMISAAVRAATPYILQFGIYIQQHVAPALKAALPSIEQFAQSIGKMIPYILGIGGPLLALRGSVGLVTGALGPLHSILGFLGGAFNVVKMGVTGAELAFKLLGVGVISAVQGIAGFVMNIGSLPGVIMGTFRAAMLWMEGIFGMVGDVIVGLGGPLQAFFIFMQAGGAAIGEFVGALLTMINPVSLIAAAIVILGAILVHWLVTTQQGHQVLAVLWAMLVKVGQVILQSLQPAWVSLQASMRLIWASILQVWAALQPLMPVFLDLAKILGGIVVVVLMLVISSIVGVITALANFVAGLVNVIAHVIQFASGVIQAFAGLFTIIKGILHGNTAEISQGWQTFTDGLKNMWQGLWGAIVGIATTFINTIKGLVGGFASSISGMFHAMADAVVHHSIWPDMWSAIHANTAQSTTQVHAQVQTFSANTQTTFLQMQTASVAHMALMWKNVQTTISSSMTASTTSVRVGMEAMSIQITASGNKIAVDVNHTFTTIAKDIVGSLNTAEAYVTACFAKMETDITKSLSTIQKNNLTAWTQINKDSTSNLSVMTSSVDAAYLGMAQSITNSLTIIETDNTNTWSRIWQDAKTYWQQIEQVFITAWNLLTLDLKNFNLQWITLDTAQWLAITKLTTTNQTALTLLWTNYWKALILLDTNNWKLMVLDATNYMKLINTAIQTGVKAIETTITALITWITQQMLALDRNATTWGADFAKNFAAGITSQIGAIRAAATAAATAAKGTLGHSKPSEGPMSDDDMWGVHFMQNFASGIQLGIPLVQAAAKNAAGVIAATMPTAQSAANATQSSQGNVTNGSEHLQVLKQILAQLKQNATSGTAGNSFTGGSTTIGYSIPSTQLGSITQQFGNNALKLSANDIANIYQQLNTLQGLSQEYGARGATTGVGF